jgi:hypothetical protein
MINVKIPQIEVPQGNASHANKDFMFLLPSSPKFGNHNLRFMDFAARYNYLNKLLRDVYIEHGIGKNIRENEKYYSFDVNHFTYKNNIETIIYWLRKTSDELISLIYWIYFFKTNKAEPQKINIDCIGKLLNDKGEIKRILNNHIDFLTKLNDISNSYKHSFINRETNHLIGVEEPTVVGLQIKNNDATNSPIFHNYYLKEIVASYVNFFTDTTKILQDMYPYW